MRTDGPSKAAFAQSQFGRNPAFCGGHLGGLHGFWVVVPTEGVSGGPPKLGGRPLPCSPPVRGPSFPLRKSRTRSDRALSANFLIHPTVERVRLQAPRSGDALVSSAHFEEPAVVLNQPTEPLLSLRLTGVAVEDGGIPLGRFGAFAAALDRALRRIGVNHLRANCPPATAEEQSLASAACQLRLSATKRGSFVLECAQPTVAPADYSNFAAQAVEYLVDGVAALADDETPLPAVFDDDVVRAYEVMGRVFKHGVDRVEFASIVCDRRRSVSFDSASIGKLKKRRAEKRALAREVVGRLQMADLDEARRRCRVTPQVGEPVDCEFPPELAAMVSGHLGRFVRVLGVGFAPDGSAQRVRLQISSLQPMFDSTGRVAESSGLYAPGLSPRSGLRPGELPPPQPAAGRDLWTDDGDFEAFLTAVRSARSESAPPSAP